MRKRARGTPRHEVRVNPWWTDQQAEAAGWVGTAVGGNGVIATLFASVAGALMYFATLTEVPILQGLIGAGMGPGPALALLLAGPALSLPNMIVIAYELEKLSDIKQFPRYCLMITPELVVDGELKVQGKVPSLDEIKAMLASGR